MGYRELDYYGQTKIEKPNINRLAAEGMIFTQYYSVCTVSDPARCTLLTSLHNGKPQVRSNDPMPERGDIQNYLAMFVDPALEGNRPLKAGMFTVGTMLKSRVLKFLMI
jgi:arylsulfatase